MDVSGPVLLFDGKCGLCLRCVRLLLVSDLGGVLRFAPLQGEAAQIFLRERELPIVNFDSAIFVPDWARRLEVLPLYRTDALLASMRMAGGIWRLALCLRVVPRSWRDAAYQRIARRRGSVFGEGDFTTMQREFGRERFLV